MKHIFKDNLLAKKNIVVTGGGSGLGRGMGELMLSLGANVIISSRKLERLEKAADEMMTEFGNKVLPVACDVRNYEQVEDMLHKATEEFGEIHGLINNAAGNFISPTERLSNRAFETIIDIVLKGSANCTMAFGKHWIDKKEKKKVIINVLTTYAWTGSAYVVPSASAKAGVMAMMRSLAVEWAKYGIRFHGVAPGPFPTKGAWDRLLPGDMKDQFDMTFKIPLKRVGEIYELANLVCFLMSDMAEYLNGEVITIDGGEWLKGAGQFNMLEMIPDKMWDKIEQMTRSAKS